MVVREAFLGHDPEGGGAPFGSFENTLRIADSDGRLLALDRFAVTGADAARRPICPGGRLAAHGSFAVIAAGRDAGPIVDALRDGIESVGGAVYGGASTLPNGCGAWARVGAADGAALKAAMHALWVAARKALTGHAPGRRRK